MKKTMLVVLIIFSMFAVSCNKTKISGTYIIDKLSDSICKSRNIQLILCEDNSYILIDNGVSTTGHWEVPEGADVIIIDFYKTDSKINYQATFCNGDYIVFPGPKKFLNDNRVHSLVFHRKQ